MNDTGEPPSPFITGKNNVLQLSGKGMKGMPPCCVIKLNNAGKRFRTQLNTEGIFASREMTNDC